LEPVTDVRFVPMGSRTRARRQPTKPTETAPSRAPPSPGSREMARRVVRQAISGPSLGQPAERVAQWYFRLNGCTTIENFVVHPSRGTNQRTDIDIIAVRFPHRTELGNADQPLRDDEIFANIRDRIQLILAEVKTNQSGMNPSWIDSDREVFEEVLRAMGFFPGDMVDVVAHALRERGEFRDSLFLARVFVLSASGAVKNSSENPATRILWRQAFNFMHERMRSNVPQKSSHGQWDPIGTALYRSASLLKADRDEFIRLWSEEIGVP
jgi:hypothetical protein